ncbi:uncharacterized protein EV422DRAFT_564276 [Fimicolochytrium jonesii]|uniref:uncharacterized protein n=1 Tax=Fimicolochytrium jonesii TaxID=1396493 RepID=UPI0022FEE341|nr:uncharacterized protein EV422DRAFT_564276 [Fimicolochytrium jonesii]KAI8824917.1 hypothetical protein EV422DRAFT_564276 [Fimicolochytrium jonesii]
MTTPNPTVYLIGLPSEHPAVPENMREQVATSLAQVKKSLTSPNIHLTYRFIPVTPDANATDLKRELAANRPDAVIIGAGIRMNPQLNLWFEEIVAVIQDVKPSCRILFNTSPTSTVDAARRAFPNAFKQ